MSFWGASSGTLENSPSHYRRAIIALALFILTLSISDAHAGISQRHKEPPSLHILASTSLESALSDIIKQYTKEHDITISVSFDNPITLSEQIQNGEAADLFITEHPLILKELKQRGLIDVQSTSLIAKNELVLAASKKHHIYKNKEALPSSSEALIKAALQKSLIVLADSEQTALGILSEAILSRLEAWNLATDRAIKTINSTQTSFYIQEGSGIGIIYASDLTNNDQLVALDLYPSNLHDAIYYQAAVVAGTNMATARTFLTYLKSDEANSLFKKNGFLPEN